jgi:hypothetical protein
MAITNDVEKNLDWIGEAKEILQLNFRENSHPNQETLQAICSRINSIPGYNSENLAKKVQNWFQKERGQQKTDSLKEDFDSQMETLPVMGSTDAALPKGKLLLREYFSGKDVTNEEVKQRSTKIRKVDISVRKESTEEPNIAYITEEVTVIHQSDFEGDRMKENEERMIEEEEIREEEIDEEDESMELDTTAELENTYEETILNSTHPPENQKHFEPTTYQVVTQDNMVLPLTPIDDNEDKMNRKRQRNRMAATKCRQRKLNRIAFLEEEVRGLTESLEQRKTRKSELESEISQVKVQIQNYVNQGATWMQQFL